MVTINVETAKHQEGCRFSSLSLLPTGIVTIILPSFCLVFSPSTYPKEKLPSIIPRFNPESVVCVGIYACGLNLEYFRWHSPLCLDAHVFVDN